MGSLNITELARIIDDNRDYLKNIGADSDEQVESIQAPQMPPVTTPQNVTFSTVGTSAVFNASTRYVLLVSTIDAYLVFGAAPVATATNSTRLPANTPMFFGVQPGHKVSVHDGVSA